jgi:hypothetical protein
MEARLDGYLHGQNGDDEIFAIVEAKAHVRKREKTGLSISMQESAEMVSWIRYNQAKSPEVKLSK